MLKKAEGSAIMLWVEQLLWLSVEMVSRETYPRIFIYVSILAFEWGVYVALYLVPRLPVIFFIYYVIIRLVTSYVETAFWNRLSKER